MDRGAHRRGEGRLHVALTPTWNETAYFADYVLPMGHGSERHDIHSYEPYDGQWLGFRQPVLRAARERLGETITDTPAGQSRRGVGGERVLDRAVLAHRSRRRARHPAVLRVAGQPGEKLSVDEYYGWIFENSVPGLPERAAAEGLTPLEFMRRYGAFEIAKGVGARCTTEVPAEELDDVASTPFGRVYTRRAETRYPNIVPRPPPTPDDDGRRPVGVEVDGEVGAASRRPAAGSSSTPRRWPTGAGRSTRCPATSRATSTRTRWRPIRWC